MNAKLLTSPLQRGLALGCLLFSLFAARSSAVTISSTVFSTVAYNFNTPTALNTNLGTFDFSLDPNWSPGAVTDLGNINITLSFSGLNTDIAGFDYNKITLTLGGADTGILLNGFDDGPVELNFNQAANNASAIISYLNNNNGKLTFGLSDSTNSPANYFGFNSASTSLSFVGATVTPVPFTPVQTLGFGLIALVVVWRQFRGKNPFALVMARVAA